MVFVRSLAVAAAAMVLFVPAAGATVLYRLDAAMTVGEPFALPSQTVLGEGEAGQIGEGTLVLIAPAGFEFDTSSTAVAVVADAKSGCRDSIALRLGPQRSTKQAVKPQPTTITFAVTQTSRGRCTGSIGLIGVVVNAIQAGSGELTIGGTSHVKDVPAGSSIGTWTATKPTAVGAGFSWGSNIYGELGQGFSSNSLSEPQTVPLDGVRDVAAGDYDSFAVLGDGSVWGWGMNSGGALGDGTSSEQDSPVQAHGVAGAVDVAAGYGHTLALLGDGSVWAWGGNWAGQLGDGTTTDSAPKAVPGLGAATAVVAGRESSYALVGGTLYAWGGNSHGQLGTGDFVSLLTPTPVLSGVAAVSAGDYFVLALRQDGSVWGAGNNDYGQLGIGAQTPDKPNFVQAQIANATVIGTGDFSSFATTADGAAWGWGENENGQIGLGYTSEAVPTPTTIAALHDVKEFSGGQYHTLALLNDGTVWSVGSNYYGQLGVGNDLGDYYTATPVKAHVSGVSHIAARELHSLASS